jgi:hypothetical protein
VRRCPEGTTYDVLIFDPSVRDFAAFVRLMKHAEPSDLFTLPPGPMTRELRDKLLALSPEERASYATVEAARIREWIAGIGESLIANLRRRYEYVPIFVIKPSSTDEYSVLIRPPGGAYVEKASKVPLEMAVLRLDARAMFTAMGPLA